MNTRSVAVIVISLGLIWPIGQSLAQDQDQQTGAQTLNALELISSAQTPNPSGRR